MTVPTTLDALGARAANPDVAEVFHACARIAESAGREALARIRAGDDPVRVVTELFGGDDEGAARVRAEFGGGER